MRAYRGTVVRAPASFSERLSVVVEAFNDGMPFEAAWMPRPNDATVQVPTTAAASDGTVSSTVSAAVTGTVSGSTVTGTASGSATGSASGIAVTFTGWTPAAAPLVLPQAGEQCIVVMDDGGDAWAWTWPYA